MKLANEISWISPKVEFRPSKFAGKGMFAIADIKEGEKVVNRNFAQRKGELC